MDNSLTEHIPVNHEEKVRIFTMQTPVEAVKYDLYTHGMNNMQYSISVSFHLQVIALADSPKDANTPQSNHTPENHEEKVCISIIKDCSIQCTLLLMRIEFKFD